ncbi:MULTISPECIES: type II secretion system protein GspL [unclassified Sulfitobacter]|uniref:type II secretion system protein GspL n=1 Tax=unclassified Sulfitobacter TaxID=196795 RepID=UPI0007C3E8CF|nr:MULTISPECIES: type II secretion system protein GspL [unclassified Sulfitobacter]KZX95213.1 hypothetical protein A3721_09120 [Sulfitobacter sp. HI0023]KZY25813.1 hypothetical protein A3728_00260 [Sulfitobacter sp. HI0040]KZZ69849.1 hypothetical protein A3764_09580 [Sulfitobacter sp. HI0129]
MINQGTIAADTAPGRPGAVSADGPAQGRLPLAPAASLLKHRARELARLRRTQPEVIASEHVGAHAVDLPKSGARQREALLTYAVEDRIAAPIDSVRVAQGPGPAGPGGEVVALVCERALLNELAQSAPDASVLPEFLLIPRPAAEPGRVAWSVWREGERAVVRSSDGTGFAAPLPLLELLWAKAGRPDVLSLAMALPESYAARDLSDNPPPADPADLAFSFSRGRRAQGGALRIAGYAALLAAVAVLAQLAILANDTLALRDLVERSKLAAQTAAEQRLPGVVVTEDVDPLLARLAPRPQREARGDFLPLLDEVAGTLATSEIPLEFRRMSWGAEDGALVVLIQTRALDDLQAIQQVLESAGFTVRSGAANASDGGAEAELRIARRGT